MTLSFTPIDAGARTGSYHLLQDRRGHQHCGHWDRSEQVFAYSGGKPIRHQITAYAARQTTQELQGSAS